MKLPPELDFERPTLEERYNRAVPGYMKRIADLYSAITDRFGDEGLELIREVSCCPYPFDREEICRAHTHMEKSLVATLDDSLEHRVGKMIPRGDPCCEHIVVRRKPSD